MIVILQFFKVYEDKYKFIYTKLIDGPATCKIGY